MSRAKRDGEPEGSDLVLKAASRTPATVQQALSRLMSSPRAFNLVVSNIPGPTTPMYMLGCKLQSVYPMVPLSENHAVSVGMLTVHDQACFGVYSDRQALPDVDVLASDVDAAVAELLAGTTRVMESPGSLLMRAHAALRADAPQPGAQPLDAPNGTAPGAAQSERSVYERELQRLANDVRRPIVTREADRDVLRDDELAAQRERVGASGEDPPGNSAGYQSEL